MRKEDFFLLAQKYLDGKATEQEKQQLNEWYDSFDDSLVSVPAGEEQSGNSLELQMLSRLKESLKKDTKPKTFVLGKKPNWIAAVAILLILLTGAWFAFIKNSKTDNDQLGMSEYEEEEERERNNKNELPEAIAFDIERTKNPATGKVPWEKLRIAVEQTDVAKALRRADAATDVAQPLTWFERGPNGDFSRLSGNSRPNDDQTSGRIRAIMVDSLDPTHKTVFAGSVAGGLWKTTDITVSPSNWTSVNDFLSNLAIADICQDPRPGFQNIMYLCTGESFFNADAVRGVGVFKSTDAGANWSFLPSTNTFLNGTRILCDNLGNVYLGTRGTGLRRSTDGGATWTNITPTGLTNDICDLEISSTAVAGRLHVTTGINSASGYRFTDIPSTVSTGIGWNAATTPFTSFTNRIEMAISGNVLYALPADGNDQVPTIWKSSDGGTNWASTVGQPTSGWASQQAWYALSIAINPANTDECIVGGLDCHKTSNGGNSWTKISTWAATSGQYVHADQHDIQWWDGGTKLMFACDGGIHFSTNGGTTIRDRNKGLRIKQFYSVAIHPTLPNFLIGGAQDNGMHRLNHPGLDSSIEFYGGDGMYCAIDQNEAQFQFGSYVGNVIRRSTNGGASWGSVSFSGGRFVSPWDYDNNGNVMYLCNAAGSYLRWNNPQTGSSSDIVTVTGFGSGNVSAVHASPYTANRVYFGMGSGGIIAVDNANAGTSLAGTVITPAGSSGYANCVVTGSSDQILMACYSSYGVNNVWVSTNGGTNWTACDGNLPDMPVRWGLFHPDGDGKAFIATETGVWETDLLNGAATVWSPNTTFPNVRTDMIKYRASDRTIAAGTHGRGMWTASVPLPSGFDLGSPAPATAACPAPASMSITLTTTSNGGFVTPITFTATGAPSGTTIAPIASVVPGNSTTVTLNGTNTLNAGSYTIQVTGSAAGAPNIIRNLTYTVTAGAGPTITTHPLPQTLCEGSNATFTVVATGTYVWQVSTPAVPAFTTISGQTAATLTLNAVTAAMSGNQYRCVVSSQCGSTTSNPALLTVNTAPAISAHPQSVTLCAGSNNTFSVTATGTGISYQWQISTAAVPAFTNIPLATTSTYTENAITAGMNGNQYRCVVTGTCPSPATSNPATLTVVTSVGVTTQPVNTTACDASSTSFTVAGSGAGVIYQWQVNTGSGFVNIPAGAPYTGINSGTLNINPVTNAMNNYQYRALLSNATCTTPGTSNTVTLTVNALPSISANPQNATICIGGSNTFSVTASGTGISYQWQVSTDGGNNWASVGANAATYTVSNATAIMHANQYRVVVTGTCSASTATSSAATLTVITPVAITTQPSNAEVCSGSNATFSVVGSSTQPITYQWQVSTDGGANWTSITGANAATYTANSTVVLMSNNRYRVQLSNTTCTVPTVSNSVTLIVRQLPTIGLTASQTNLTPGQSATLTATPSASTGGVLTTSWTFNGNPLTVSGTTYVANVEKIGTYQARIQETWLSNLQCATLSPVVTLVAPASSKLFIFPTPNDGRFTVSYYNNGGTNTSRSVTIYDSRGIRVEYKNFTVTGPYTLLPIDIRPAQRGIYYVVVGDAGGHVLADGKVIVH